VGGRIEDAIVWHVPRPTILAFLRLAAEISASDSSLRGILMGTSGDVIEYGSTAGVEGLNDGDIRAIGGRAAGWSTARSRLDSWQG
jgi:hypothetical protein